jgi:hypothetical protein
MKAEGMSTFERVMKGEGMSAFEPNDQGNTDVCTKISFFSLFSKYFDSKELF